MEKGPLVFTHYEWKLYLQFPQSVELGEIRQTNLLKQYLKLIRLWKSIGEVVADTGKEKTPYLF